MVDRRRRIAAAGVIFAAFLYGWAGPLIRWAGGDTPMLAVAFYRMLVASLAWTPFWLGSLAREQDRARIPAGAGRYILIAGGFLGFHFATWTSSIGFTTVASATFLILAQPILVALAAHLLLKERLNRWNYISMTLTLLGAFLIFGGDLQLGPSYLLGDGLALLGAVGTAGYLLVARMVLPDRTVKGRGIPIQLYLPPVYWTATLVLLAVCMVKGVPLAGYATNSWIALVLLGLGPTVIGHSLF
ncbi:EamA family transporter, partial [bacterium]|nr:EamA family transporter [bacterium]